MSVTRRHQDNRAHRATVLVMTLGLLFWQVGGAQAAPRVEISVDDAQVNEGNTITYRVEMTEPPATPDVIPVSVQIWSTAAGANPVRVEMGDMGHHRLWFTEGVERHTLTVRTRRQAATNATSTVKARVESSNRFSITGDATVTAQAVDHAPPSVEAGAGTRSLTMVEGETAQFVIELDDAAQSDLDVNVRTQVTSGAANHYPRLHPSHIGTRTVVIRRGSRRAFVPVTAYDDNAVNHDKVVSLTLLAGTGYTVGSNSTSEATFRGDIVATTSEGLREGADTARVLWNDCGRDALVNEAGGAVRFTVDVEGGIEAQWTFTPSRSTETKYTAEVAKDFVATNTVATYTMEPSDRSKTFSVAMVNDEVIEDEERFALVLAVNGPINKNIQVDGNCSEKVARISDDDIANLTVGKQTRRVEEGEEIALQVSLDADTSTTCADPVRNHPARASTRNVGCDQHADSCCARDKKHEYGSVRGRTGNDHLPHPGAAGGSGNPQADHRAVDNRPEQRRPRLATLADQDRWRDVVAGEVHRLHRRVRHHHPGERPGDEGPAPRRAHTEPGTP